MSRERFVARHQDDWTRLDRLLCELEAGSSPPQADHVLSLYRGVTQQLALVRHRRLGLDLEDRLNALALRAHQQLYRERHGLWGRALRYAAGGFAAEVRRDWRFMLAALLLFGLPFWGLIAAIGIEPDLATSVLASEQLAEVEEMYSTPPGSGGRDEADDLLMFGVYVWNNVGIAFRTFASGVFLGLGSIFFLVFNGVHLGAVSGHLNQAGLSHNFVPFVIGHGAFELTAIVLAGGAGLKLGWSLIAPGQRPRTLALRETARETAGVVAGLAVMLVLAAFLEAFWSPARGVAVEAKLAVGGALWVAVLAYFLGAGRGS